MSVYSESLVNVHPAPSCSLQTQIWGPGTLGAPLIQIMEEEDCGQQVQTIGSQAVP